MSDGASILMLDPDRRVLRAMERMLEAQGYCVSVGRSATEGLALLRERHVDVVIFDGEQPDTEPVAFIQQVHALSPGSEGIMLTTQADIGSIYHALQAGVLDWFGKPIQDWARFHQVLERAHKTRRRCRTPAAADPIVGHSPAMERVRELIGLVATSSAPVLVVGESGVGKELVARAVHKESRRDGRFVGVNCGAIPESLIEGELFGWKRGAFTGAVAVREGMLAEASDGTLLLDEIGEMPLLLQTKLLRVLEDRSYRPLGGSAERTLSARVLAATNQDLKLAVAEGRFRHDLYYRLDVVTITVPPLRERPEDIPLLVHHFVRRFSAEEGRPIERIDDGALRRLERYSWPGNIRQLKNLLHRAVLMSRGRILKLEALPAAVRRAPRRASAQVPLDADHLSLPYGDAKKAVLGSFTQAYLRRALARAGGNITRAAESAGMLRPNFKRLMRQHGVDIPPNVKVKR